MGPTTLSSRVILMGLVWALASPVAASEGVGAQAKVVVDGSSTVGPIAKAFAARYMLRHPDVNIAVSESGSGNGAKSLINGACDVANMSRFMKPAEFQAAVQRGVMPVAHVVAIDGLAVIVHPRNPTRGLTLSQLRDLYTGRISNWQEVGGPDHPIVKISRDTNSGTYEAFESIVMDRARVAADTEYVGSNGAMRQRVQTTSGAIGFVGLGFVDRTVKPLAIDGVLPERGPVAAGRYPLARPLYAFTNGYPRVGSHLHAYLTLHLTPAGHEIIESLGYVPLTHYPSRP